jgi:hypothetical protein
MTLTHWIATAFAVVVVTGATGAIGAQAPAGRGATPAAIKTHAREIRERSRRDAPRTAPAAPHVTAPTRKGMRAVPI